MRAAMPAGRPSRVSLASDAWGPWDDRDVPPRDVTPPPRAPKDTRPSGAVAAALPAITGRAVILGLVAVTLLISLSVPVRAWFAQRAQLASLRAEVDAAQLRVAELSRERAQWDDPTFVAAQARTRLHFVLPGEVGYVALGLPADVAAQQAAAAPPAPWFSSMWSALQQADDHAPMTSAPSTGAPTTSTPVTGAPTAPAIAPVPAPVPAAAGVDVPAAG